MDVNNKQMKKLILTLTITLFAILVYSQTVTIPTTLLRIDGIEYGQLIKATTIPLACEYQFVVNDTLDWTTVPIDSLQFQNTNLQNQIDLLNFSINALTGQVNGLQTQVVTLTPRPEFEALKARYEAMVISFKTIE